MPISAAFVRTVKTPGIYGEGWGGHGLSLRVLPRKPLDGSVRKQWVQRLHIHGKPVNVGLGSYPVVSLAEAREKALANRRATAQGRDPRVKPVEIPTFAEASEAVIELQQTGWKNPAYEARIWRSSFRNYALPRLGSKRISEITPADVLAVLMPIWPDKAETGRRVRQRIAVVMRWSIAQGHRQDNPAGEAISQALPRSRRAKRHYPALPYADVAAAIAKVRASRAYKITVLCFEFLVLTVARSGEARLATWDEIDFETATWTIPAERMKAGRMHRVPLSDRAVEILREAQENRAASNLVFPSVTGKALSSMMLSKLVKELGIGAVPHGYRSSFRDFASEQTDAPRAVMEAALAHKLGDAAEQAYARSDLLAKRRALLAEWADYLSVFDRG